MSAVSREENFENSRGMTSHRVGRRHAEVSVSQCGYCSLRVIGVRIDGGHFLSGSGQNIDRL